MLRPLIGQWVEIITGDGPDHMFLHQGFVKAVNRQFIALEFDDEIRLVNLSKVNSMRVKESKGLYDSRANQTTRFSG